MKVLLLAAGRSKRMKPIEDKNFLYFLGEPLIVHQLQLLKEAGLKDVLVVGGAHNLGQIAKLGGNICEQKDLELGMAGAVLAAAKRLGNSPVLIFSGNDVVDATAFRSILKAAKGAADSYILGKKTSEYFPGGYLEVAGGLIKNIVEKPKPGKEPSNLINLVVHLHKNPARLVKYLKKIGDKRDDSYEAALSKMIKDGVKMQVVKYDGFWQPIKYPWHAHKVFRYFFDKAKKGVAKSVKISKNAVINGEVIIGEGVNILDGAVINGPCYIGPRTTVATNALVRDSHIGADCVIGFGSEVARSYLGDGVWTHTNYIGDSVIGNNVAFGAGAVTGNLRLDEENIKVDVEGRSVDSGSNKFGAVVGDDVRIGVNSSLMPGVKIGAGSFIGAGIVVSENIPPKSFARGDWKLKISKNKFDSSKLRRDAKTFHNNR